jgi:CO/xanthine dehydrogenase FAD-binding subunit
VDVLSPRTLGEALRLKSERPDAVPIQGGTDVMVELNFDRARPSALLNLNEVEELRGWSRGNGVLSLGAGLTPLLIGGAGVKVARMRGERVLPLAEFLLGPKRNALAEDELIVGVSVRTGDGRETFMKVGPRNAMVIAVVSLAVRVDGELRAAFGSAGPVPALVQAPLEDVDSFPDQVAEAASPIDDVRGTAAYRRHALHVLTKRALERCLA